MFFGFEAIAIIDTNCILKEVLIAYISSRRAFIDSFRLKLRRQNIFYGICSCELLYSSHLMNSLQEIPAHHFSFVLPARFWFRSDECTQVNLLTDLLHVQQIIILNVARIVFSNIYSTAHENHIQVFVIALTIYFKYAAILVSKQHKSKLE